MLSQGSHEEKSQVKSHSRIGYLPALDGLRAVAVLGVLFYHADLPWFKGGFLGVDVFFVISGYLITSLLLAEWNQTAKLNLISFWGRRARRLLPALYVLLSVVLIFSVFFLHDEVARLRTDASSAFTYVTNWYLIFNQQSYFETMGRPSLFQHLWSLAVEEQFYVVWPVVFFLLVKFARRIALPLVTAGAIISAALMAVMYSPDTDPSRVYYGTDTRAAALFVGVALSFLLTNHINVNNTRKTVWLRDGIGAISLAIVVAFLVFSEQAEPFLFLGGFFLLELVVAVLIASIALPGGGILSKVMGSNVPRWLGLRSYGIYLWHWPVFMLTRERVDVDINGPLLLVVRLALTMAIVELSYRFVETPIRQGALQRLWREFRSRNQRPVSVATRRLAAILATLLLMAITLAPAIVSARPPDAPDFLPGESVNTIDPSIGAPETPLEVPTSTDLAAIATATGTSSISNMGTPLAAPTHPELSEPTQTVNVAPAVGAFVTLIPETAAASAPTATHTASIVVAPAMTGTPEPTVLGVSGIETVNLPVSSTAVLPTLTVTGTITANVNITPTLTPVPGDIRTLGKIVAIGDSVMLGASKVLTSEIPNLAVDAKVARQASAVVTLIASYEKAGLLGDVVLIHIGNNGSFSAKQFDQIMSTLANKKWVLFVNVSVPRQWEGPNNTVIAEGVARYPNTLLVNWHDASLNHRDYFATDGYHLQVMGQKVYAALIVDILRSIVPPPTPTPDITLTPYATPSATPLAATSTSTLTSTFTPTAEATYTPEATPTETATVALPTLEPTMSPTSEPTSEIATPEATPEPEPTVTSATVEPSATVESAGEPTIEITETPVIP